MCVRIRVSLHFNPRTPCGVRRASTSANLNHSPHFNPRTPCGVRLRRFRTKTLVHNFNPRTPCGVRRASNRQYYNSRDFNPRTPCGVRQFKLELKILMLTFQSTHPMRGATVHRGRSGASCAQFQSTHPMRGATLHPLLSAHSQQRFQSTHPMRGATGGATRVDPYNLHFNPRTPCGVRRVYRICEYVKAGFQSTHPMRGATDYAIHLRPKSKISIHAPHAGCDTPDGMACDVIRISIHAPHAGCDKAIRII